MIDRQILNDRLHNEILLVTFTRRDGTERVMECTLRPDLLPLVPVKEGKRKKTVNEAVIPVYDLEAQAFRSFRVDSVKKVDTRG